MNRSRLKRIPFFGTHKDTKEIYQRKLLELEKRGNNPRRCANTLFYLHDNFMDDGGLQKGVLVMEGMLFQMEREAVDPQLAYEAFCDCEDIMSGDYDDLINPEDRASVKADATKIMAYLDKHPELVEGAEEELE